jgi:DNA primase small subunit
MDGRAVSFSQDFVCGAFSDYYESSSANIPAPSKLSQREFAFLRFKGNVMVRHRSASNLSGFRLLLRELAPSDVYHSCAYYENPEAEMDKKGWIGADLVFDIDADHIPTACSKIHDEWTCNKCGFGGKGVPPQTCPICNAEKFLNKTWPCSICLDSAKKETRKLVDLLGKDFGFSSNELHLFFSGHRGYHVHIENEKLSGLDSAARREIVDYVCGLGLSVLGYPAGEKVHKKGGSQFFSLANYGWGHRLKQGIRGFIRIASVEELKALSVKQNCAVILKKTETDQFLEEGKWELIKGVGKETLTIIAKHVRDIESAKIDTVVTTDIHRLIRMNGTLHGKTGLKKIEFPLKSLDDFDPFEEVVAFKDGTVKVFVSSAPQFQLGGNMFGPYRDQEVELPTAAAVLLICKGRAEVKE